MWYQKVQRSFRLARRGIGRRRTGGLLGEEDGGLWVGCEEGVGGISYRAGSGRDWFE